MTNFKDMTDAELIEMGGKAFEEAIGDRVVSLGTRMKLMGIVQRCDEELKRRDKGTHDV